MTLNNFTKSIKQNAAAIITAIIVFLLVTNYLVFVIPKNELLLDNYNKSVLEEFNFQFNNTLKDYTNQVDLEVFKEALWEKAKQKEIPISQGNDQTEQIFLSALSNRSDTSFYNHIKDYVIIKSITIDTLHNAAADVHITRTIRFKFTDLMFNKYELKFPNSENITYLTTLKNVKTVRKKELAHRLSGAIFFKDWMIYTDDKEEFLNHNIDFQEFDSISKSASKLGILTFTFSDKRFYRQSFAVEGTDYKVILIGAVSQSAFQDKAKQVNSNALSVCIVLVILLFLCIPMAKPIISSAKEKLTQLDLLSTTTGIGIVAIVVAVFIFTSYLSSSYKKTLRADLTTFHGQIKQSFRNELAPYQKGFAEPALQRRLHTADSTFFHTDISSIGIISNGLMKKNLQNYFCFSEEGDIIKNVSNSKNFALRKNFAERDYFKQLKGSKYKSMLSAVYSKNDNKYKLVFIQKGDDGSLSGYAYVPEFTLLNPTDGTGGYLLCQKNGRVILHSDSTKSLNENIFTNTHEDPELLKLFHGMGDNSFEANYNGEECMFYGKKLDTGISDAPLYLITYKNLSFANSLKIYTIVNGFIISLAYVLSITALILCFSVFFYLGNIPIISRFHVSWLFPDNSREREYWLLRRLNYAFFSIFFIMFMIGIPDLLYFSMITGVNISFFAFVLLNQRAFIFDRSDNAKRELIKLIGYILMFGYIIPFTLNLLKFPGLGFSSSLLGAFAYLYKLRNYKHKHGLPQENIRYSTASKRFSFVGFFSSVISYHYFLVPSIVLLGLFNNEISKMNNYHNSVSDNPSKATEISRTTLAEQRFYNSVELVKAPSRQLIERMQFDSYQPVAYDTGFKKYMKQDGNFRASLSLLIGLVLFVFFIKRLINFYSGRFFFFDLSEAYRLQYFTETNQFTNFKIILPPFNDDDLEALEKHERFGPDEAKHLKQNAWLKNISGKIVSNEVKLDLIMMDNFKTYHDQYLAAWNTLSDDEKFVMNDFAIDHFVNYKNKHILLQLMEKGYIIADPLTGRLRVMNYGFRNFVIHVVELNPEAMEKMQEEQVKGTYSKWRLPIIIVAVSALLLMMYLSKESFNQILFVGGSVLSAMGLIAKFLDTYKK